MSTRSRTMKDLARLGPPLLTLWLIAGCGLQKPTTPATVLKTEDFIADSTTIPTEEPPANASIATTPRTTQALTAAAASEGLLNVVAAPGEPETGPARAVEAPALIDAKIGELNGRSVRARDLLSELGPMLQSTAKERKLTADLWTLLVEARRITPALIDSTIKREEWVLFARRLFELKLNRMLEDQLLAEEARFSLREPDKQAGLKHLVNEIAESARREAGGSRAVSQERLRQKNQTEGEYKRETEARLLIEYELFERLRKRIRTSWKDVRLYYERNPELFNPPPVAHFRLIQVPIDKPDAAKTLQDALDSGKPFAEVAAMPENTYNAREGGRYDPQKFTGEFEKASFFPAALNQEAVKLKEGEFTKSPVDSGKSRSWVLLERIERRNRPLSDRDVQLVIANRLNSQAFKAERDAYIERLKLRATFTDLPVMAQQLAEIAAERYWPKE